MSFCTQPSYYLQWMEFIFPSRGPKHSTDHCLSGSSRLMLSGVWLDRQGSRLNVDKFIFVPLHCHNGTDWCFSCAYTRLSILSICLLGRWGVFRNMIELETLIMVLRQLAFFPFFPSFFFSQFIWCICLWCLWCQCFWWKWPIRKEH